MRNELGIERSDGSAAAPFWRDLALSDVRLNAAWLALFGVVGLSFTMNVWSLNVAGYGNTYYAAAVRSMTVSWKNFFFGAFDPGGFITVDKPPVFLWAGALSARVFGYSTWSILLPSAFAGAASVGLLWVIVRRFFGAMAGTIAALVLALSPISVAVDRLNLPEPFMILLLIGAAGATLQSLNSKRWWAWTALAGLLVGIAFNVKMLAAWIPGPAFALAIVLATRTISWQAARDLLARLAVLGVVTLVVSASWLVVVDLWPASARPYVGGSTDNTVLDLVTGYNGFGRVDGNSQGGGGGRIIGRRFTAPNGGGGAGGFVPPGGGFPGGGRSVPPNGGQSASPFGGGNPFAGAFNGAGGIIAGVAGPWRMFDAANGPQIAWLLPFALIGGLMALWYWRRDPVRRAAAILFLGWVVLYGGVFSDAQGIYHSYYTSAIAPGVAALVAMGAIAAINLVREDKRWFSAIAAAVALTLWTQLVVAGRTPDFYGWVRPFTVFVALVGLAVVAASLFVRHAGAAKAITAGVAIMIAGLLFLPGAWSLSAANNASLNATLPQAGPQQGASGVTFGSLAFDDGTSGLASWLQANDDPNATWDVVVSSSQNGSRLIAQYGLSVMSLGGFSGSDNTITVDQFADIVAAGDVRYVLTTAGFGGARFGAIRGFGGTSVSADAKGANAIMPAVEAACTPVTDPSLPTQYENGMYDCSGAANALRATVAFTS